MLLLIVYATVALGISFLCSMLEASLLSIPPSHVAMLTERGSRIGRQLQDMKSHVDRPLSAILTLNTIAHTVGAIGVGAEAANTFGHASVGVVSAAMTGLILVVSEIIPKTLGAVHAKSLAGFTAITTHLMTMMTYPIVVALQWTSQLIAPLQRKDTLSRGELLAAVRLGRQAGSLDAREYQTVKNLMSLGQIKVNQILTPRTVLMTLPEDQTVDEVIKENPSLPHARIPIYRDSIDNVTGYVTRYELDEAYRSEDRDTPISELARPIQAIPEQSSVANALNLMLHHHEHILTVVDEYGGLEGIVTLEDVIETLLGMEIVDETDMTTDLQEMARRLAQRRRAQGRRSRESPESDA